MPSPLAASTGHRGLTEAEAEARLRAEGPNQLPSAKRRGVARIAWTVARQPMFLLLVGADHPLAEKKSVKESDLEGERVLLLDEGHCLRDQALEVCRRAGADATHEDFRATSLETLRHMVAAGMGVTLMPALAQKGVRTNTVALPFAQGAPKRRMALCWRKSHPRPADHRALARFLREQAPEGARPPSRAD